MIIAFGVYFVALTVLPVLFVLFLRALDAGDEWVHGLAAPAFAKNVMFLMVMATGLRFAELVLAALMV